MVRLLQRERERESEESRDEFWLLCACVEFFYAFCFPFFFCCLLFFLALLLFLFLPPLTVAQRHPPGQGRMVMVMVAH